MTRQEWIDKCNHWKAKWPVIVPEYANDEEGMNLYAVLDAVNRFSPENAVIMGDAGSISYAGPQALQFKKGQRMVFSPSQADMGWALPASIGVAKAGAKCVICIVGDGSFMSNMQELAVIREHNLPIKIVILNNGGYLSIRNTQSKYYGGRVHGVDAESGLWFPPFMHVANAFRIEYAALGGVGALGVMEEMFRTEAPVLLNCYCTENQEILPSQALKDGKQAPLHDMIPFLSDEELAQEMLVTIL